jgi:hypothetical protein
MVFSLLQMLNSKRDRVFIQMLFAAQDDAFLKELFRSFEVGY